MVLDELVSTMYRKYDKLKDKVAGARNYLPSIRSLTIPLAFIGVLSASEVEASQFLFEEIQITTNSADQYMPDIHENKIVWTDNRNGNWDIYMYDLSTGQETQITTNTASQEYPAIHGNRIVWQDNRNNGGRHDIYMYDLTTNKERRITTNFQPQSRPDIFGDIIVYRDIRSTSYDIYMYDLKSNMEVPISTNPADQYDPHIYGNKIVWFDYRNGNADIYMYDLGPDNIYGTSDDIGEVQITTNTAGQIYPEIHENKVIWMDCRNGCYDIYMYDLSDSTEMPIILNGGEYPVIYNNWVATNGVELHNIETGDSYNLGTGNNPAISGSSSTTRIVYDNFSRSGNYNIYLTEVHSLLLFPKVPIITTLILGTLGSLVLWYGRKENGI